MISVVIPTHKDPEGAYLTAAAAFTQLEKLDQQFEIIFAVDLGPDEEFQHIGEFSNSGAIYVRHGSPQGARHEGILKAKGSKVFCLDSHVICSQDFFKDALDTMATTGAALVLSPLGFRNRNAVAYGYALSWQTDFWNGGYHNNPHKKEAYRISCCGHGAFLLDRDIYMATGGYTLEQKGWGGEETFLNMKMWMLGYTCWILPQHYHWHYMAPQRNNGKTRTDIFAMNFCIAAEAIGGHAVLENVFEYYKKPQPGIKDSWHEIVARAKTERERIERGPYKGNLRVLLDFFKKEGIPF